MNCNASVAQYGGHAQHCAGNLPLTGFEVWIAILIGLALFIGGIYLHVRSR